MADDDFYIKLEEDRRKVTRLLSDGLETETHPRADSSEAVRDLRHRLRMEAITLEDKLIMAGLTDHMVEIDEIEQQCMTCIYFLQHSRYCDLAEIRLPVEPGWSCRLWRM